MNSVHEPGPNGDSKISPSRNPVRKTKPDAQAPSRPSRHAQVRTGAPRCSHGRRIVTGSPAVSWQGAGRVAGPSGRIATSLLHAPLASACAPAPSAPAPASARPARSLAQPTTRPARLAPYRGLPAGRVVVVCARRHGRIVACLATQCSPASSHNTALLYCNTN